MSRTISSRLRTTLDENGEGQSWEEAEVETKGSDGNVDIFEAFESTATASSYIHCDLIYMVSISALFLVVQLLVFSIRWE